MEMKQPIGLFIVTDPKKQKGRVELFNALKTGYEESEDPFVNIFPIVADLSHKDICRRIAAITEKDRYIIRKIYVCLLKGEWPYKSTQYMVEEQGMILRVTSRDIFGNSHSQSIQLIVATNTPQKQVAINSTLSFPLFNETSIEIEDVTGGCEFHIYFYPEKK